jgi:plastocyanin
MRRFAALAAGIALVAVSATGGQAQGIGPVVSINIVEPKDQSKWGYSPAMRRIDPGTWVTWSNDGQDAHTITADDGSFDSMNLDPSDGFSWFFDQPGLTYHYTCTLHPWMKGTIVVSGDRGDPLAPPDDTPPPAAEGSG